VSKAVNVYVDSCVFLSWFKDEPDADECKGLFDSADKGEIKIITSSITLTEVIKLNRSIEIPHTDVIKLRNFFEKDFIMIASLERRIAEKARELIWKNPHLQPKDSIHLATAIYLEIQKLYTFDNDLLKLKDIFPDILICKPDIPYVQQIPISMQPMP